jgi:hypothetical protein
MKKPETTSPRVAKIAGTLAKTLAGCKANQEVTLDYKPICTVGDLKALAASALTQAPDKKAKSK